MSSSTFSRLAKRSTLATAQLVENDKNQAVWQTVRNSCLKQAQLHKTYETSLGT
jgi:hypothetical protein